MTILCILLILVLALFGLPLFLVIGGIAMLLGFEHSVELSKAYNLTDFFTEGYNKLTGSPTLVSIPLFTFAGYVMAESKTGERLVRLFQSILGWLPGGLTIQIVVVCSFFTVFTGASGVTIIALGTLLYPMMLKARYPEDYSLGVLTASGSLGLLFPLSLPLILYGVIAGTDIRALFLAGILPGMLLILVLALHGMWVSLRSGVERTSFSFNEVKEAFWDAKWEAILPVLILWLYFKGFVTLPQVSVVTATYILLIEALVYKDINLKEDLFRITQLSLKLVGSIIIILLSALALSDLMIEKEVPDQLFKMMSPYVKEPWQFLIVLNIFLLLVGCLLDIFSAILVVVPLIVPLANQFGIDPVHLGIIFLANLELGYLTPPVGINLFISSLTFRKPVLQLYRVSLPFLALLGIALLLITYIPAMSLWMPTTFHTYKVKKVDKNTIQKQNLEGKKGGAPDLSFMEGLDMDGGDDEEDDDDDEDTPKKGKKGAKDKKGEKAKGDASDDDDEDDDDDDDDDDE